jgi:hypothetical protein
MVNASKLVGRVGKQTTFLFKTTRAAFEHAPISPGSPQHDLDQRLRYRHIFKMQEGEALSEHLRFVLVLQSQTQSRMHAPEPIFQPQQDVFGAEELTVCHADFP